MAVIVAPGGTVAALAAKETTSAIPIVFYTSGDPVSHRLVTSLNRPGGNLTGIGFLSDRIRSETLRVAEGAGAEYRRNSDAHKSGQFWMPNSKVSNVQEAARLLGCQTIVVKAANEDELHAAFAAVAALPPKLFWSVLTHSSQIGANKLSRSQALLNSHDI